MVVNFSREFDLRFGLRKGEPMFRRLVPLWVMVSTILAGGSAARAQMPFPVDLVPTRTALERLGLERQWFAVIPLVETERLMKITLAGDMMFAQTDYAMLHAFDAESGRLALDGPTRGANRIRPRRRHQLVRGLCDERQYVPCSRQAKPAGRSGNTTWARFRPARQPATKMWPWSD